ncbi:MAG: hypothetical protein KBT57_11125 [bacterium]|nr:hypothetical protein [Candidatus Limimorpha equi]
MNRKLYLFGMLAMVLLLASCKKDNETESDKMTISAGIENDGSKTHLDGLKVKWIIGDQIKVYDNAVANGIVFTSKTLTDDDQTANFTCDIETGGVVENGRYWAVYPTSGSFNKSTEKFSFEVSETQSYNNGVFDCASFPMVAYTTKGSNKNSGIFFYFKHACGVLKIAATGNTQITSVKLTDNNNKLCGNFTVDANAENLAGGNGNTITMNASVTLSSTPTYFYFILPAGALSNGFTLQFLKDGQDVKTTEYTGSALEIARSTINTATIDATKVHYFSVSSTKKVIFAKGNLVSGYDGGNWGFQDAQWKRNCLEDGKRGFFYFSTYTNNDYGILWTEQSQSGTAFKDWGELFPGEGWFTLSDKEWIYLLGYDYWWDGSHNIPFMPSEYRVNARNLFRAHVTVNGVKGLLLLPDDWNSDISNVYDLDSWAVAEGNGAVFLPAASGGMYWPKSWGDCPWPAYNNMYIYGEEDWRTYNNGLGEYYAVVSNPSSEGGQLNATLYFNNDEYSVPTNNDARLAVSGSGGQDGLRAVRLVKEVH